MKREANVMGISLGATLALIPTLIIVAMIWPVFVPPFSPLLPKPRDVPAAARASFSYHDGMVWRFCLSTPWGVGWVEDQNGYRTLRAHAGLSCRDRPALSTKQRVVLDLFLSGSDDLDLAVGGVDPFERRLSSDAPSAPCPVRPTREAYAQAAKLLDSLSRRRELRPSERKVVASQAAVVASWNPDVELPVMGFQGSNYGGVLSCAMRW